MSEETKKETKVSDESSDSSIYYVLGGVVLVAAVAGFFLLRPKNQSSQPTTTPVTSAPAVAPTPAPITKFACEKQYFNPVVGFPKYFLSLEGVDKLTTGTVKCSYSVSVKDKVVVTAETTATLRDEPSRGGGIFRCQTDNPVELARGVPTKITVKIVNPNNETADCSQSFIFP